MKTPPKGDITLVPYANPYGMNLKMGEVTFGRFDPNTGDNWNRFYAPLTALDGPALVDVQTFVAIHAGKDFATLVPLFKQALQEALQKQLAQNNTYARKLNLQLQQMACQADIVLDLHCDTISLPHAYAPWYALESALDLNFGHYIEVPEKFGGALDEASFMPWWHLTQAYNQLHPNLPIERPAFEAFTLELGCYESIDLTLARTQVAKILSYLTRRGVVEAPLQPREAALSCKSDDLIQIAAPTGGMLLHTTPLGKSIAAGETLALISQMGRVPLNKPSDDIVLASSHVVTFEEECIPLTHVATGSVIEGMQLMKVMRRVSRSK
jgi:predicted deacylase